MSKNFLPKGCHGFTQISNTIIDALLGSKLAPDNLSLAVYLLRHVPNQTGMIRAIGRFSQACIMKDLGISGNNKPRLRRAIKQLEQIGLLRVEVEQNNTAVFFIDGKAVIKLHEISTPGTRKYQVLGKKILPSAMQENHVPINNKLNKSSLINHHNKGTDDDDLEFIFNLFRSKLRKPITNKQALNFLETFNANNKPKDQIIEIIQKMANNPWFRKNVTSINAVFEYDYLAKKARQFEVTTAETLQHLAKTAQIKTIADIHLLAEDQGFDGDLFVAHFADLIEDLFPEGQTS